jgi:DNA polymerase-3 subunit beta
MIDQVVFAASTDDSRPSLTGVLSRFEGDQLTLAATDGYRLSVRRMSLATPVAENVSVIVPARSLAEVARVSGEADAEKQVELSVATARNQILFRIYGKGDTEHSGFHQVDLVSQLIDAKFPDYNAIIPKNWGSRSVVDTAAFLKAARVASLFARDSANNVRFHIAPGSEVEPGQVTLRANSAEVGDNVSEVDAKVEGNTLDIAFNVRYLMDVLAVIDTPQVVLETSQANRPGVLRPVGTGPDEFTHVIMPMQLSR